MRIKTILREDEIQLTLSTSELVWLQVLLSEILGGTLPDKHMSGWAHSASRFKSILNEVKKEGFRINKTTPELEESEMPFIDSNKIDSTNGTS